MLILPTITTALRRPNAAAYCLTLVDELRRVPPSSTYGKVLRTIAKGELEDDNRFTAELRAR